MNITKFIRSVIPELKEPKFCSLTTNNKWLSTLYTLKKTQCKQEKNVKFDHTRASNSTQKHEKVAAKKTNNSPLSNILAIYKPR